MKLMLRSVFILAFTFLAVSSYSQSPKFGHINSSELLILMPERADAQKALQSFANELEEQLTVMNSELEVKYGDYTKNEQTYNNAVKQARQREIQDLQMRIQEFQQMAQENYQTKEAELFQPIINKANKAVQEVGKENGFFYIFDITGGSVVYFSESSIDVLPLVKTKLGISQ